MYHQTNTIPVDRTTFLQPAIFDRALGPFPRAYDYFRDGSMFVIDAPGHLPSHINLLVRTNPRGSWLYLAGDSAHDLCCLTGDKELGEQAQSDYNAAVDHVQRVGKLLQQSDAQVILAHDFTWFADNKNKDVWFPNTIPSSKEG
jgi:glyoxylase-like metal-dependent hydrolase (beta-lactamase superfamily II)